MGFPFCRKSGLFLDYLCFLNVIFNFVCSLFSYVEVDSVSEFQFLIFILKIKSPILALHEEFASGKKMDSFTFRVLIVLPFICRLGFDTFIIACELI